MGMRTCSCPSMASALGCRHAATGMRLQACSCRHAAAGLPVPGPGAGINASDATVYENVQKARA